MSNAGNEDDEMMIERVHCCNCIYAYKEGYGLTCRARSPQVIYDVTEDESYSLFPVVNSAMWCGEGMSKHSTSTRRRRS